MSEGSSSRGGTEGGEGRGGRRRGKGRGGRGGGTREEWRRASEDPSSPTLPPSLAHSLSSIFLDARVYTDGPVEPLSDVD